MLDTGVVLTTLIIYKLLLIAIGLWAQRRVASEQDFFLAGRQLGPWVAAISYCAMADPTRSGALAWMPTRLALS